MVIRLQDITLFSYHGVLPEERKKGNLFRVSVALTIPTPAGVISDDVTDTCDYSKVYDIVTKQMAQPSNLLEHVAGRIINALKTSYPEAQKVEVSVSKQHPPVGGNVEWATIELADN